LKKRKISMRARISKEKMINKMKCRASRRTRSTIT